MTKPPDTRPYELALLRGIFDPQAARDTVQAGNTKLFSDEVARSMYSAFLKLHFDRVPVTEDAIRLEMATSSDVPDEAVSATLLEVMDLPVPSHPKRLIDGLASLRKRALLHELREYLDTPEAIKGSMAGAIAKINEFTHTAHTLSSAGKVETLWDTMQRIMEREGPSRVWEVGLGDYLNRHWVIRKPSYTVIAADSGSGKTAMLIQIAKHIASQGTNVGIISLEMTKEELTFRAAAQDAGIDSSRIEDNLITDEERAVIFSVMHQRRAIYERFFIMDDSTMTVEQLPAKYNEFVAKHQCEVILLDYLQR
ncbi:MAG TPA: DnaB-like helicase C-terminal domain-containing protein, partial [Flavobacteriales bacterium]|nr:DnaB-like helicase C-terminal domain-containing protein [Flavobacteriales bacterium]